MSTWLQCTSVASSKWVRSIFTRNWPRHRSSIHITMRMMIRHQRRNENNGILAIVSSHSPSAKTFLAHESSQQTVDICSINAAHAKKGYIPIVYAPQESTSVQNVLVIILPVPKTIFPHQAEFSHPKKRCANAHQYLPGKK